MARFFSSGSLHEGDEIAEINGKSVANQTVDQLQKILVSWAFLAHTTSLEVTSSDKHTAPIFPCRKKPMELSQ